MEKSIWVQVCSGDIASCVELSYPMSTAASQLHFINKLEDWDDTLPPCACSGGFWRRRIPSHNASQGPQKIIKDEVVDREAEQAQIQGMALNYAKCLQVLVQARGF